MTLTVAERTLEGTETARLFLLLSPRRDLTAVWRATPDTHTHTIISSIQHCSLTHWPTCRHAAAAAAAAADDDDDDVSVQWQKFGGKVAEA